MALKRKKRATGPKVKSRSVAKKTPSHIKAKKPTVLLHDDREKKVSKKSISKSKLKASSPKRKVTVTNNATSKISSQSKELTATLSKKIKTPVRREPVKEYQFYNEIYRIGHQDSKPTGLNKSDKK